MNLLQLAAFALFVTTCAIGAGAFYYSLYYAAASLIAHWRSRPLYREYWRRAQNGVATWMLMWVAGLAMFIVLWGGGDLSFSTPS